MALTNISAIRLEIGLVNEASDILSDEEIAYFLEKNNNSVRKASLDVAKTVLFVLSQQVHERSGLELEIWGHSWFENYLKTLTLYINNPNFSIAIDSAKAYAGGISKSDIRNNIEDSDVLALNTDIGIPTDGIAEGSTNTNKEIFNPFRSY